jgi:ABC-type Mn2+/Zn2+ transport system permease subunit/Mn-dependent DtxR family transcriptional regulator
MESLFQYDYAIRALLASGLVGLMCGILGCFIFLRNMALVGDALSHAILPGVVAGFLIAGQSVLAFFIGSVAAGLIAAFLITYIQTQVKSKEDAAIGVVFSTLFSIGVIGISLLTRQEGVHLDLKDFLFGNVLAITPQDLWLTALVACFVVFSTITLFRFLLISTFDQTLAQAMGVSVSVLHYFLMLLLSFTVVACMQSVGVILVVGMLILPASAAYTLTRRLPAMVLVSALTGVFCTISGFLLAYSLDITPGPAMNVVGALVYILSILFSPENGKISLWRSRRQARRSMKTDDLLKALVAQGNHNRPDLEAIRNRLGWSAGEWKTNWERLVELGWLEEKDGSWNLTGAGLNRGFELVGAHRTWEQFMVETLGYDKSQVHAQAEELEHFLTPQLVEELQTELGNPLRDPHGAYIPRQRAEDGMAFSALEPGQKALILARQDSEHVMALLWKEGLSPNHSVLLLAREAGGFRVRVNGQERSISPELGQAMRVVRIENQV